MFADFSELYTKCPFGTVPFIKTEETFRLLRLESLKLEDKEEVRVKPPVPMLGSNFQIMKFSLYIL